jgi:uncharacterized MAPEG superfamily protein
VQQIDGPTCGIASGLEVSGSSVHVCVCVCVSAGMSQQQMAPNSFGTAGQGMRPANQQPTPMQQRANQAFANFGNVK